MKKRATARDCPYMMTARDCPYMEGNRNDLKDLLDKGVFKKVGKGRSVRYVLAE